MEAQQEMTTSQRLDALCKELGLTISAVFVPWSQSRSKDEKDDRGNPRLALNWRLTLYKATTTRGGDADTRGILMTDYSAGIAHCPAYKRPQKFAPGKVDPYAQKMRIEWECENGLHAGAYTDGGNHVWAASPRRKIEPNLLDVVSSLVLDASVLDASSFEEWASDCGYDTDSRKAEAVYKACLEIALKLRNGLGDAALAKLRDVCQDY